MPIVHRADRFKICIYADDHPPPHFHAVGKGFKAIVLLSTLELARGSLPPGILAESVGWAAANRETLDVAWKRLNERD